jgi:uncharacterized protein YgiM (DUF1202 family)
VLLAGVVGYFVLGYVQEYRAAQRVEPRSSEATSSAGNGQSATQAPQPSTKVVVILIDGLNFRTTNEPKAKAIRGLKKGEQLTLLEKSSGWYRVRDAAGVEGWVSANPQYLEVRDASR